MNWGWPLFFLLGSKIVLFGTIRIMNGDATNSVANFIPVSGSEFIILGYTRRISFRDTGKEEHKCWTLADL